MTRLNPAHLEMARRLLTHESLTAGAGEQAAAAGRLYDKIHTQLAALLGDAGVELLFVRSAKLAEREFVDLAEIPLFERSLKLRERLHARIPAVSTESAAILFGTFFTLTTAFIGERLTTQALHKAWPTIDVKSSREPQ